MGDYSLINAPVSKAFYLFFFSQHYLQCCHCLKLPAQRKDTSEWRVQLTLFRNGFIFQKVCIRMLKKVMLTDGWVITSDVICRNGTVWYSRKFAYKVTWKCPWTESASLTQLLRQLPSWQYLSETSVLYMPNICFNNISSLWTITDVWDWIKSSLASATSLPNLRQHPRQLSTWIFSVKNYT